MDQQMLLELQQMGINPYQFQMFLQSPYGQQVTADCKQHMVGEFTKYMQSVQQNLGQQQMGVPGKHSAPNEETEQLTQENQALKAQLEKNDKDMAELKEMFLASQKGGKNGNK